MTKKSVLNLETGVYSEVDLSTEEQTEHDARVQAYEDSAFDRAMVDLRAKRDRLIAETDFYALSDVTMSSDMTTYRQNLRDITNGVTTVDHVNSITWPTKP
jgi:hypothetical protein